MGFSSFTCAKTNLPILNHTSWGGIPDAYRVVLLFQNGDRVTGEYDGYGRVHTTSGATVDAVYDIIEKKEAKLVLQKFCTLEDTFTTVGKNHHEPGQGHFHDATKVRRWYAQGGFKNYSSYKKAMR